MVRYQNVVHFDLIYRKQRQLIKQQRIPATASSVQARKLMVNLASPQSSSGDAREKKRSTSEKNTLQNGLSHPDPPMTSQQEVDSSFLLPHENPYANSMLNLATKFLSTSMGTNAQAQSNITKEASEISLPGNILNHFGNGPIMPQELSNSFLQPAPNLQDDEESLKEILDEYLKEYQNLNNTAWLNQGDLNQSMNQYTIACRPFWG